LEPGAAQKLWKKFEKSRKVEGQEESYQHAMKSGPGSLEKSASYCFCGCRMIRPVGKGIESMWRS
jgi:hypothetical protein